jgi:hypothetical protein
VTTPSSSSESRSEISSTQNEADSDGAAAAGTTAVGTDVTADVDAAAAGSQAAAGTPTGESLAAILDIIWAARPSCAVASLSLGLVPSDTDTAGTCAAVAARFAVSSAFGEGRKARSWLFL